MRNLTDLFRVQGTFLGFRGFRVWGLGFGIYGQVLGGPYEVCPKLIPSPKRRQVGGVKLDLTLSEWRQRL